MSDIEYSYTTSSELSTAAVSVVACAVTFTLTLTVTAIITFIVTYYACVKKTFKKADTHDHNKQSPQDKIVYEEVRPPIASSHAVTKNDLELQPNPAYGTSHNITMDTNPAYESYK